MITVGQIKAARAFLGLTQSELAEQAGVSLATVNNIERGVTVPHRASLQAIQLALEAAGIEFIDDDGLGVKLKG